MKNRSDVLPMKIKLFEEFIAESSSNPLIDQILVALEPMILQMIDKQEKYHIENEIPFTSYDRLLARLTTTYDLLRSIEIYTKPSDVLISIHPEVSLKGNIKIYGRIQREDTSYFFETEAIIAGGYRIQRAHYRYITKTTLPKTGNTEKAAEYFDQIKKLTKLEKLNKEIDELQKRIDRYEEKVARALSLSDEEIFVIDRKESKRELEDPTWEEIVRRGADKNFNYDKNTYEEFLISNRRSDIQGWKILNINSAQKQIIFDKADLARLNRKVEQFAASIKV